MIYSTEMKLNSAMAILAFVGGSIGYVKSKSLPSLIAGSVFGILYSSSAYFLHKNENKLGLGLSVITSSLLVGSMGKKAIATQKPVPIVMSSSALVVGLINAKSLYSFVKEN
ncbi:hypothetical protein DICPUDRAFT_75993 [Dictyostelium purpureum]|uniref:Transmembrane protein 14 n=1 Tax=Dictyostelium purpureum TaxID=5786 RepID=F0ZC97_DICPU|nr:uncharacterized protein DICPUDRAFT_75993 [Dictyostelium purpureum]EGC38460.1 hypothetical protein DICPUDRAFT_75993 [Dictyostelium purpureum]|eukprot:XP_003285018.1 hypothetical protein DICPUDRAFT_75993 [Dictyostelium purpureum]